LGDAGALLHLASPWSTAPSDELLARKEKRSGDDLGVFAGKDKWLLDNLDDLPGRAQGFEGISETLRARWTNTRPCVEGFAGKDF
jgi:hypothetical protein